MASTEYLDDLRFCPDCGEPTASSWRTWGNSVCDSTAKKVKCRPLRAMNFCGRCGKPNPGEACEGCTNPRVGWLDYEKSDREKWFWANFSPLEIPLIVVFILLMAGLLLAIHLTVFPTPWNRVLFSPSSLGIISAGVASYGLTRSLLLSWLRKPRQPKPLPQSTVLPSCRTDNAVPVARVIVPPANSTLVACPDCNHMISKSAAACPNCGCAGRARGTK